MLIGCLPLVLMFDMKDDNNSVDAGRIFRSLALVDKLDMQYVSLRVHDAIIDGNCMKNHWLPKSLKSPFPAQIAHYMETLDVFISVKPKPKQPSKSVIVKSMESNYANVYEARRLLLSVGNGSKPNFHVTSAKASSESASESRKNF